MIKMISLSLCTIFFIGCGQPQSKYAIVQEGDKDGVLDKAGYIEVKPIYKQIFDFSGDDAFFNHPHLINLHWIHNQASQAYAIVENIDGKYGIINQKGKLLLKPIYDSITYFFDGFARIQVGDKYGLINTDFKIVLKPTYDYISEFTGNIAILHHKDKYGCINKKMELKIKPTYDRIYFQQEDFLRTTLDKKWGYLDNQCNVLSKPIFDYGYDFSNGIAKVVSDGKVGYLNSKGNLIVKPIFTKESSPF